MTLTAVIVAHDRPAALGRLLASVDRARPPGPDRVVVSIDPGGAHHDAVVDVARRAVGAEVVVRPQRLGLVAHVMACGDLGAADGDVVLLEDDLEVGPGVWWWARAALGRYRDEPRVGAVALNALWFNGLDHTPFEPLGDGSDVFFLQVPWYDGLAFTSAWWTAWRQWAASPGRPTGDVLPEPFGALGADEWFGEMTHHLVDTGRHAVFPRRSHATGHGDAGAHFGSRTDWFQTVLDGPVAEPRFVSIDAAMAVYDTWFELDPAVLRRCVPGLPDGLVVDLRGGRVDRLDPETPILTTELARSARRTWGTSRRPLEANVLADQPGTGISLTTAGEVRRDRVSRRVAAHRRRLHAGHGRSPSLRRELAGRLADRLARGLRR